MLAKLIQTIRGWFTPHDQQRRERDAVARMLKLFPELDDDTCPTDEELAERRAEAAAEAAAIAAKAKPSAAATEAVKQVIEAAPPGVDVFEIKISPKPKKRARAEFLIAYRHGDKCGIDCSRLDYVEASLVVAHFNRPDRTFWLVPATRSDVVSLAALDRADIRAN